MSFFDNIYLVAGLAMLITMGLLFSFIMPKFMGAIGSDLPAGEQAHIEAKTDQLVSFINNSFVAIFLLFAVASIALTFFLVSHPIALAVWLIFCIVTLIIWDALSMFITALAASSLNTGDMNDAIAFFTGDLPKALIIVNLLMGIVMYSVRGERRL